MATPEGSQSGAGQTANGGHSGNTMRQHLHHFLYPVPKLEPPISPALLKREEERAKTWQNRLADRITAFSGSMLFVYVHIVWFGCWIGFGVEKYPYGLLTMIVSLEAIFLSTFVLISQNRADARRQVIADEHWKMVQEEDKQNVEPLRLSRQILALTQEVRTRAESFVDRSEFTTLTKEIRSLTGALTDADRSRTAPPTSDK
jgi:uncharacterized membrane protein